MAFIFSQCRPWTERLQVIIIALRQAVLRAASKPCRGERFVSAEISSNISIASKTERSNVSENN